MSDGMDVWDVESDVDPMPLKVVGHKLLVNPEKYDSLLWLLKQFSGKDLWMDGTSHWSLPHNVLSGIRAKTSLDAILEAKRRYDRWCDHNASTLNDEKEDTCTGKTPSSSPETTQKDGGQA